MATVTQVVDIPVSKFIDFVNQYIAEDSKLDLVDLPPTAKMMTVEIDDTFVGKQLLTVLFEWFILRSPNAQERR